MSKSEEDWKRTIILYQKTIEEKSIANFLIALITTAKFTCRYAKESRDRGRTGTLTMKIEMKENLMILAVIGLYFGIAILFYNLGDNIYSSIGYMFLGVLGFKFIIRSILKWLR